MGGLLQKLENYYEGAGILSTDFECKHRAECGGGREPFGPKSSMIGEYYEKNHEANIPRFLVLSADPRSYGDSGDRKKHPNKNFLPKENRVPEKVRWFEAEAIKREEYSPNAHWRITLRIVFGFIKASGVELSDSLIHQAVHYFAHVNSVKCSQNTGKQAEKELFENCRDYLRHELGVLKPDIILSQGEEARDAMMRVTEITLNKKVPPLWDTSCVVKLASGKEVLWVICRYPVYPFKDASGNWIQKTHKEWIEYGKGCAETYKKWCDYS